MQTLKKTFAEAREDYIKDGRADLIRAARSYRKFNRFYKANQLEDELDWNDNVFHLTIREKLMSRIRNLLIYGY